MWIVWRKDGALKEGFNVSSAAPCFHLWCLPCMLAGKCCWQGSEPDSARHL